MLLLWLVERERDTENGSSLNVKIITVILLLTAVFISFFPRLLKKLLGICCYHSTFVFFLGKSVNVYYSCAKTLTGKKLTITINNRSRHLGFH